MESHSISWGEANVQPGAAGRRAALARGAVPRDIKHKNTPIERDHTVLVHLGSAASAKPAMADCIYIYSREHATMRQRNGSARGHTERKQPQPGNNAR